jgi:hypothetical protein
MGASSPRFSFGRFLRYTWPILVLLGILWFPFDWLSTVWPLFGVPFRMVFRNAHDHFLGHALFFGLTGILVLAYSPRVRLKPQWYIPGLILAMLAQETIQAFFRGTIPTFTDFNAFSGDALGGMSAFFLWFGIGIIQNIHHKNKHANSQES